MNNFIIYKATSPSGKIYIGLTSQGLNKRKYDHYYSANKLNLNTKFYKALRKYSDCIIWEIIKTNLSRKMACLYEQYFIKKFDSYKNGYNTTLGGETGYGIIFTKERLNKMSEVACLQFSNQENRDLIRYKQLKLFENPQYRNKHKKRMKEVHGRYENRLKNSQKSGGKPFNVYNLLTKQYVKTYEIIMDANIELGVPNGKISWCLKGKRNFTHIYIFKYLDDPTVDGQEYNPIWDEKMRRKPNVNVRR